MFLIFNYINIRAIVMRYNILNHNSEARHLYNCY